MGKNTKDMDRRKFMKTVGLGGASSIAALSSGLAGQISAGENKKKKSSREISVPTRILGKTKTPVSILALGGMVDLEVNQILLKMAIKFGVTYWDTAHMYQNGKSEIGIGKYFKKFPENRKKVFLCTKASGKTDPEGMTQRLHLSLERMKTDYIDLYLMHNPKKPDLLTPEVKAWAEKAKREGKIKFFGFSTHSNIAPMLMHASKLGWIDGIMPSYNYHLMIEDE
ncbi:MAG: aldo/keto reductase, partial [Desulfobacterales bacterium]